ncbi:unnamed protein product [Rotaria sp. Silwood1]|nr:unnamed protein product [Rotaria sp. Silwood1]
MQLRLDLPALIEPNGIQYRWLGCNLLFSTPIHFNKIFVFIYNNNNNDEDVIVDRGVSLDVDIFGDNLEELSVSSTTALPVNRTSMTNSLKQIVKQKRFY